MRYTSGSGEKATKVGENASEDGSKTIHIYTFGMLWAVCNYRLQVGPPHACTLLQRNDAKLRIFQSLIAFIFLTAIRGTTAELLYFLLQSRVTNICTTKIMYTWIMHLFGVIQVEYLVLTIQRFNDFWPYRWRCWPISSSKQTDLYVIAKGNP